MTNEVSVRLHELRTATLQRADSLVGSFEGIVEAASDVATDDEHDPEGHTIAWERQQVAGLLEETRAMLADIEAAELRLASGTYGICTVCDLAVSDDRMVALPATPTCVNCAR